MGLNLTQAQLDAAVPNSAAGVNITAGTVAGVTPPVQTTIVAVTYQHNFIMLGPIMSLINATWSNQDQCLRHVRRCVWSYRLGQGVRG